jgi:hypothetical protein
MGAITRGPAVAGSRQAGPSPLICAVVTTALALAFWFGLVWLAHRLIP